MTSDQQFAIEKLKDLLSKAEAGEPVQAMVTRVTVSMLGLQTEISFLHCQPRPEAAPVFVGADPPLMAASWKKPSRSFEWRNVNDPPGWESGQVEVKGANGDVRRGELDLDSWFDGESSHPLHELKLDDGSQPSLYDFVEWRWAPPADPGAAK